MNCVCHGEPAYWKKDSGMAAGGWWQCAVQARAQERERYHARHRERKLQQQRERYDSDPFYRIEKNLHDHARRRRETITRRRILVTEQED